MKAHDSAIRNSVFWTDKTKVEMFGHNAQGHLQRNPDTAYQPKHVIPADKHGDGGMMSWACLAATGPGHLSFNELKMNSSVFKVF